LLLIWTKMTSFRVHGSLAKNDIIWEQANSTGVPPNQKVNKAEELTYFFYKQWQEKVYVLRVSIKKSLRKTKENTKSAFNSTCFVTERETRKVFFLKICFDQKMSQFLQLHCTSDKLKSSGLEPYSQHVNFFIIYNWDK